jgi:NMD protein affecting ribosome stability and mRNA decay
MKKEKCIRCGKETEYDINTPVDIRKWYIEGTGQLCEQCYFTLYPVPGSFNSKSYSQSTDNSHRFQKKKE